MDLRIEICGNIASGKTTLCTKLTDENSFFSIYEDFHNNPFYEAFYVDPVKYTFETELTFLLQHYHAIKAHPKGPVVVCDYSILQDLAYADANLKGNRHRLFLEVADEVQQELGQPDYLIHLICPEDILLERIIARSRDAENSISIDYLKAIATALNNRIEEVSSIIKVIKINSDTVDFRESVNGIVELETVLNLT